MSDSRPTSTRRRALKLAGMSGFSGVAGLTGLSLTTQPALALSESVRLPTGLTEGSVNVSSYEIQYAELDTTSDITITYILQTSSNTLEESHTVSITESTGAVMSGSHSINVPSGEVTMQVQLKHPSVGTVSTQESTTTTVASAIPDSVVNNLDIWYPSDEGPGSTLNDSLDTSSATFNQTPTWQSFSGAIGGTAPELDGTDDRGESDAELSTSGAVSACGWVYFTQSPPFQPFSVVEDRTTRSDAFGVRIESDRIVNVGTTSSTGGGGAAVNFTPSQNTWYFIGIATDGSSNWLYVWDNSSLIDSASSSSYSILPSTPFAEIGYMNSKFSEYYGGFVDGVGYRLDAALSQVEFESIWQDTQR